MVKANENGLGEAIKSALDRNNAVELRLINRQIERLQQRRASLLMSLEHQFCRQPQPQPDEVDGFDRLITDAER